MLRTICAIQRCGKRVRGWHRCCANRYTRAPRSAVERVGRTVGNTAAQWPARWAEPSLVKSLRSGVSGPAISGGMPTTICGCMVSAWELPNHTHTNEMCGVAAMMHLAMRPMAPVFYGLSSKWVLANSSVSANKDCSARASASGCGGGADER